MKSLVIGTAFILVTLSVNCQIKDTGQTLTDRIKAIPPMFVSQGEQEDYWAEKLFEQKYKPQNFNRLNIVVLDENTIKCGKAILKIYNTTGDLKMIFKKGIYFPGIMTIEQLAMEMKDSTNLDSTKRGTLEAAGLFDPNSLTITDFEEMKFMHTPPQIKRFRFWLFIKGFANPTICFIELTNAAATEKMNIKNFIEASKLTFYQSGWVII